MSPAAKVLDLKGRLRGRWCGRKRQPVRDIGLDQHAQMDQREFGASASGGILVIALSGARGDARVLACAPDSLLEGGV